YLVTCALKAEQDGRLGPRARESAMRSHVAQGKALFQAACERGAGDPKARNDLAWSLATCPDPRFRDAARAVELARGSVERAPREGNYWNTLGVALYRAGDWKAAVEALGKSMQLGGGGNGSDWFFLAMAHARLGDRAAAKQSYDKAVRWVE